MVNLKKYVDEFLITVKREYQNARKIIFDDFKDNYNSAGIEMDYVPENLEVDFIEDIILPEIKSELLRFKKISYEEAKSDFFGMFRKSSDASPEMVEVITYDLIEWRKKVSEITMPLAEQYLTDCKKSLNSYVDILTEGYHKKLIELLNTYMKEKEETASQLSNDEKKLQEDNDWYIALKDQLEHIKRD